MNAYLEKDLILTHKSGLRKVKLVERGKSLLSKLDYRDNDNVKDMIRIAEKYKDMAVFI
jgi:hypothetical protein